MLLSVLWSSKWSRWEVASYCCRWEPAMFSKWYVKPHVLLGIISEHLIHTLFQTQHGKKHDCPNTQFPCTLYAYLNTSTTNIIHERINSIKNNVFNVSLIDGNFWKRPLGRPRRRWVDNIKMDLREKGWDGVDWIYMAQDRDQWRALVNTVLILRVP
jgi:hypothetical protein